MAKFIIEFDSSRKDGNNQLLPFSQFVPGILSLKNTKTVYTLFVGETNKNSLVDNISSFKTNIRIYQELLGINPDLQLQLENSNASNPIPEREELIQIPQKNNPVTGQRIPFKFNGLDVKNIPFMNYKVMDRMKRNEIINIQKLNLSKIKLPKMSLLEKIKLE